MSILISYDGTLVCGPQLTWGNFCDWSADMENSCDLKMVYALTQVRGRFNGRMAERTPETKGRTKRESKLVLKYCLNNLFKYIWGVLY